MSKSEVNLRELFLGRAINLADPISIVSNFGTGINVEEDRITLLRRPGHIARPSDNYRVDDIVYLLTSEQVTHFVQDMIVGRGRPYQIADIRDLVNSHVRAAIKSFDPYEHEKDYLIMNARQSGIYHSLGIDKVVAVRLRDIKMVFEYDLLKSAPLT